MSVALKIVDQTLGIRPSITWELRLASERITLRELLKRRIDEEVAVLNAGGGDEIKPLIAPTEQESRLNGERRERPTRRMVDPERQLAAAVEAFERRRIVIIVDNRQALDLDQAIVVTPTTEVRFLKLVPLVGG
jgi:hypothetical protein